VTLFSNKAALWRQNPAVVEGSSAVLADNDETDAFGMSCIFPELRGPF